MSEENEESEEEKERAQKEANQAIRKGLGSGNTDEVLKAVKKAREEGSADIVSDLVKTWVNSSDESVRKEIMSILYDLKDSDAIDPLVESLDLPQLQEQKEDSAALISVFWNFRLDASPFVHKFVEKAVQGTFMECFESLTVIENLEGPFEEEDIMEARLKITEYQEQEPDDKKELIEQIDALLKKFEDMV